MAVQKSKTRSKKDQFTAGAEAKAKLLSFCSLFLITLVPLCLTMTITYLFGSSKKYQALDRPFWFPSLTLIHTASVGSALLMSLAACYVWADGGFRLDSDALPLYISQVSLSIVWDPLVLKIGEAWLGVVFSLVNLGTLFGCYCMFGKKGDFGLFSERALKCYYIRVLKVKAKVAKPAGLDCKNSSELNKPFPRRHM
ncbi:conserved hypothetical protein [Ricinus communis]|uniref:Uncharacterized protein n=1 Tax=Ricinus communis TaxID=3988 RepID=B9RT49_RICCO|nr:conserved hypothetical protein [Ricinus communis]